jgi:hypothetical protein
MSPRQIVEVTCECPYVECEQHISYSRGVLRRTIICRHPENAGCLCVLNEAETAECELCPTEEDEETETVHIDVKRK